MRTFSSLAKKALAGTIGLVLLVSSGVSLAPRHAHAQWAVFDAANVIQNTFSAIVDGELDIKEFILDPLVTMVARAAIQSVMRSVINWANSGFEGSPAFVDDLRNNLRSLADSIADGFISELGLSGYINTPFKDAVLRELRTSFRRITSDNAFFETNRYTLDQYSDNPQGFLRGDFSRGGIRAWIHTWMNPQNNPGGSFSAARRELERRVAQVTGERMTQLGWSHGILSWCGSAPPPASGEPASLAPPPRGCQPGQTVRTPGSFIHDRIEHSLNADIDMLVSADEIDEMIGAVLQGLVNKMLGGGGFSGLSQSSSGGGTSPVDQAGGPGEVGVSPGNPNGGYAGIVQGQLDTLQQYKTDWETLLAVALRAQARCDAGDTKKELVDGVVTQAQAAIATSTLAITDLSAIQAKLTAPAGANQTELIREGTDEYEAFMAERPSRMPTTEEIMYIRTQIQNVPVATDPPDGAPTQTPTLYMQMVAIADAPPDLGNIRDACD